MLMLPIGKTMPVELPMAVADMGRYRKLAAECRMVNWRTRPADYAIPVVRGDLGVRSGLSTMPLGLFPKPCGDLRDPGVRAGDSSLRSRMTLDEGTGRGAFSRYFRALLPKTPFGHQGRSAEGRALRHRVFAPRRLSVDRSDAAVRPSRLRGNL